MTWCLPPKQNKKPAYINLTSDDLYIVVHEAEGSLRSATTTSGWSIIHASLRCVTVPYYCTRPPPPLRCLATQLAAHACKVQRCRVHQWAQGFQHLHFPPLRQEARVKHFDQINEQIKEETVTYTHLCRCGCALCVCTPTLFFLLECDQYAKGIQFSAPLLLLHHARQSTGTARWMKPVGWVASPLFLSLHSIGQKRKKKMPAELIRSVDAALIRCSATEGSGCASPRQVCAAFYV